MARYPNFDAEKKTDAYQGYAADAFSKERAAKWADPVGGYIHAMHTSRWGGYQSATAGRMCPMGTFSTSKASSPRPSALTWIEENRASRARFPENVRASCEHMIPKSGGNLIVY